jgi:hypothetical protein
MLQAWHPHNQADVDAALALLLDLSDNYQNNLKSIPYFTRITKVDRVGFEPATLAHKLLDRAFLSKLWQM